MSRFGIKEVCDVTFYSLSTGLPALYLDTLKLSDVENKATTVFAQGGRGNPRILAWDFDRQISMKAQDALMSFSSLSLLAGNSVATGVTNIFQRDVLTAVASATSGDNQVTLTQTPVSSTVVSAWTSSDNGATFQTQITGTLSGNVFTFPAASAAVGSIVVVFYQYSSPSTAQSLLITASAFPGYYQIIGDTIVRDEVTGEDSPFQLVIYKAKLDPTFTLTMRPDGNPSVLDFNLECFVMEGTSDMMELIRY